jgi:ribonuclease P protein component
MKTIKSKKEFEEVFSGGRRVNGRLVRMTFKGCDGGDQGKVAFVAAKRLGNAVLRNRCKRVLREASHISDLPPVNTDIILFATRHTADASPDEVAHELSGLLGRIGG